MNRPCQHHGAFRIDDESGEASDRVGLGELQRRPTALTDGAISAQS